MTGRCKTCKWWEPYWGNQHHGECQYLRLNNDKALAWSPPDENGYVLIATFSNFGCVQWEAKHEQADAMKDQGGQA